jgi:hypothetical protein
MIDHYRSKFPNCHIVIYDNSSTDRTVEIAKSNNCEVRSYDSRNSLDDGLHAKMKNSIWKDAKTDWVLVCDLDELLDITEEELKNEEANGNTLITTEAWTLVNLENNYDVKNMTYGIRDGGYDKKVLFNKKYISNINYGVGCHSCNPTGKVQYSKPYLLHHYRDINPDLTVKKSQSTAKRLSESNKKNKWGYQCLRSEKELRDNFQELRKIATKVPMRKHKKITIYTITYNEELLIQFMIDHYRTRFPNCHIVIYDNSSTDKTVEIAKYNDCEIRSYNSNNTLNDKIHMDLKNSCWKDAETDWVLVCDLDELLNIDEKSLQDEDCKGSTIIKSECWHMVNMNDDNNIANIKYGYKDPDAIYDKVLLFNKKHIKDINYQVGAHECSPTGDVRFGNIYTMYHYKYINPDLIVNKSKLTSSRLSNDNIKNNWGSQCFKSEQEIRNDFNLLRKKAILLDDNKEMNMNITIYTVTFNEELLMQMMVDHYRSRFPNCHIVVYDNQSTDKTVEIAKANNCEIRHYDSKGEVNDLMLWQTKNSCWKDAKTDWVLVCDLDEFLDITAEQLAIEDANGVTKIKSECWHMVNLEDNLDVKNITYGCRNPKDTVYDKDLLFNKKFVDINYEGAGCHSSNSRGKIKNSKPYLMYHYKYVNPDIFVNKQKTSAKRLSDMNKKNNWGTQCLRDEGNLRNEFKQARDAARKMLNRMPHFYDKIQGWFNYENFYTDVVNFIPRKAHIVEVGAWKGCSTAYLGVEIFNSGKDVQFDVVDLWTGEEDDPVAYTADSEFMAYKKNIFELFKKNISPLSNKIKLNPIQMSSLKAATLYEDNSLDCVFLDANHLYENLKKDIAAWLPKVKKGGILGGHDYNIHSFPEIIRAVNECFPNKIVTNDVWHIIK